MAETRIVHRTATFASGATVSSLVDLGMHSLIGVYTAAWTAAALSFLKNVAGSGGSAGGSHAGYYNPDGVELFVSSANMPAAAGTGARWVYFDPADTAALRLFKFQSGKTGAAVSQGAARTMTYAVRIVG